MKSNSSEDRRKAVFFLPDHSIDPSKLLNDWNPNPETLSNVWPVRCNYSESIPLVGHNSHVSDAPEKRRERWTVDAQMF